MKRKQNASNTSFLRSCSLCVMQTLAVEVTGVSFSWLSSLSSFSQITAVAAAAATTADAITTTTVAAAAD